MKRKHDMSYVEDMEGLINNFINKIKIAQMNRTINYTAVMNSASSEVRPSGSVVQPPLASHLNELSPLVKQDINNKDKKFGLLAHDIPPSQ